YVAIVAGWGGVYALSAGEASHKGTLPENHSRVLAFKIGGSATLPPVPPQPAPDKPPAPFGDANVLGLGKALFQGYCGVCHGEGAVAGGVLPDLRWSAMVASADAFRKPVLEGSKMKRGMPNFGQVLTPEFAEAIRAYVISRANETHPATASRSASTPATPSALAPGPTPTPAPPSASAPGSTAPPRGSAPAPASIPAATPKP
ncbi:MAG TPA: c-type cytochrome, partial [Polyangiales bacterium]|nr:c-type cytochrome [Polyangiales bacterium]